MNWQDIRERIESVAFAVRAGVASGRRLFEEIVVNSEEVRALVRLLRSEAEVVGQLVDRVNELARARSDERYENPNDTPLSAYLLAAREGCDYEVRLALAEIALGASQTWWARQIALGMLQPASATISIETKYFDSPDRVVSTILSTAQELPAFVTEYFGQLLPAEQAPLVRSTITTLAPPGEDYGLVLFDLDLPACRIVADAHATSSNDRKLGKVA